MKKRLIILLVLLLWLSPTPCWAWGERVSRYYYASGKLMREVPYKYGKIHGMEKRYDEEGNVIGEVPYEYGKIQGLQKAYFSDGKLSGEWPHVDDKRHGTSYTYTRNGKIREETTWYEGKQHGEYKQYYPEGTIRYSYTYVNDKLHGPSKYFDKKGRLTAQKIFFQNICLSWSRYDKKGKMFKGETYNLLAEEYSDVNEKKARDVVEDWIKLVRENMYDKILPLIHTGGLTFEGFELPESFHYKVALNRIKIHRSLLGNIVKSKFVSVHPIAASTNFPPFAIVNYNIEFENDTAGVSFICKNKNKKHCISDVFVFPETDKYVGDLDKNIRQAFRDELTWMKQEAKRARKAQEAALTE